MPPRGSCAVDPMAVQMMHDWISQLRPHRKFVKDWTSDELAPGLDQLGQERSQEKGVHLFKELGCAQCHRFAEGGGGAGPNLSDIGHKRNPQELLDSILEPSKQIAPEFAATVVVTSEGQTFEGRVGQEDDQTLVLHTSDAFAKPVTVRKVEISERYLSGTSTMPDGLLDTLQKSEILDLLAFLISDGNSPRSTDTK